MLTAIIVAGGSSRRMGFDKTFAMLGGQPLVAHTLAAFQEASCVTEIILVGQAERRADLQTLIHDRKFTKVQKVVAGGAHRQNSVSAGLDVLGPDARYVALQDGARPLVTARQIQRVFEAAQLHNGATLAAPITDTLKRAGKDFFVCDSIDRHGVYAMQTPQIFLRELLVEAYAFVATQQLSITDEVSAVEHLGRRVFLVPNDEPNPKITFPGDLVLAETLLTRRAAA